MFLNYIHNIIIMVVTMCIVVSISGLSKFLKNGEELKSPQMALRTELKTFVSPQRTTEKAKES
jgi:hypothetical protein